MANERKSPDPHERDLADNNVQQATRFDDKPQFDPLLAENPTRGGRIAIYGVAIAILLGALFYGLSTTGSNQTSSTPSQSASPSTAQNNAAKPPVGPGIRDVTPSNTQQGLTTGAAPPNSTQPANPQSGNTLTPGANK
ncbi:hypothetical protein [Nitrobacter sp.]|uniref:hypothetical protein n=1 Tax=Nitrobacter sp. TaxID=29420 RepID=UPI003F64E2E2